MHLMVQTHNSAFEGSSAGGAGSAGKVPLPLPESIYKLSLYTYYIYICKKASLVSKIVYHQSIPKAIHIKERITDIPTALCKPVTIASLWMHGGFLDIPKFIRRQAMFYDTYIGCPCEK